GPSRQVRRKSDWLRSSPDTWVAGRRRPQEPRSSRARATSPTGASGGSWLTPGPQQDFDVGAHHGGDIEVGEASEQTDPEDGDKTGRDHELGKTRKRGMAYFAAGNRALDHGAHRGDAPLHYFPIVELGDRGKPRALGDHQARDVAPPRAIDLAYEQIGKS